MSEILMKKPVLEAIHLKDQAGAQQYRPGDIQAGFQGDPHLELHEEALDVPSYANYSEGRNHDNSLVHSLVSQGCYHIGVGLVFLVRALWACRGGKPNKELGKTPVVG